MKELHDSDEKLSLQLKSKFRLHLDLPRFFFHSSATTVLFTIALCLTNWTPGVGFAKNWKALWLNWVTISCVSKLNFGPFHDKVSLRLLQVKQLPLLVYIKYVHRSINHALAEFLSHLWTTSLELNLLKASCSKLKNETLRGKEETK